MHYIYFYTISHSNPAFQYITHSLGTPISFILETAVTELPCQNKTEEKKMEEIKYNQTFAVEILCEYNST